MGLSSIVSCDACGFELWRPISSLHESDLGLYSDARFPGRCILSLHEHFDQIDLVPPDTIWGFMMDLRNSVAAIKMATNADRVNVAILGNQEGHVHAHLIPRRSAEEPLPHKAPWEDTRDKGPLDVIEERRLMREIGLSLETFYVKSRRYPIPRMSELLQRRTETAMRRVMSTDATLFDLLPDDLSRDDAKRHH